MDRNNEKDMLAGLLTRDEFEKKYKKELENAKNKELALSLALLDIDEFRAFNEKYGHAAGDMAIKIIAGTISGFIKGENIIASRYSGEEFALIFPGMEREQAFLMAETIRVLVDKTHKFKTKDGDFEGKIQISGGVAAYPFDGETQNELIRNANEALYRAKKTGRNKICIAHEIKMVTKTSHYTITQLEKLKDLSRDLGAGEPALLREALDDLFYKYKI